MNVAGGKRGRITIHDVAAAAGVSISTASKALNETGRMSVETRERVKRIAGEVGFRPNALARGRAKADSRRPRSLTATCCGATATSAAAMRSSRVRYAVTSRGA